ncbi:MAG: DUF4177 domain-containing protein [Rubrimonas sp.]
MSAYVYKCLPAPRRVKKTREHRTPADAFSAAMQAVLNAEAAEGWEYVRTDLAPMEVRQGLFGGTTETHQAVLVFRRAAGGQMASASMAPDLAVRATPEAAPPVRREHGAAEIPRLGAARID